MEFRGLRTLFSGPFRDRISANLPGNERELGLFSVCYPLLGLDGGASRIRTLDTFFSGPFRIRKGTAEIPNREKSRFSRFWVIQRNFSRPFRDRTSTNLHGNEREFRLFSVSYSLPGLDGGASSPLRTRLCRDFPRTGKITGKYMIQRTTTRRKAVHFLAILEDRTTKHRKNIRVFKVGKQGTQPDRNLDDPGRLSRECWREPHGSWI